MQALMIAIVGLLVAVAWLPGCTTTTAEKLWKEYPSKPAHKAFAEGNEGEAAMAWGALTAQSAMELALQNCRNQGAFAAGTCKIVDVDGEPLEAFLSAGGVSGTCFALHRPNLVATAYHVVEGAHRIDVRFRGEESPRRARITRSSKATDLAILEVDGPPAPGGLSLVEAGGTRSGDRIFTVGHPMRTLLGSEPKFSEGVIGSLSGPGGEAAFMQVSTPVQPGGSGGPVVREDGLVAGVISTSAAVLPIMEATDAYPQDVNWAVSAEHLRPLFHEAGPPRKASSRAEAIEMARRAVCVVEASN